MPKLARPYFIHPNRIPRSHFRLSSWFPDTCGTVCLSWRWHIYCCFPISLVAWKKKRKKRQNGRGRQQLLFKKRKNNLWKEACFARSSGLRLWAVWGWGEGRSQGGTCKGHVFQCDFRVAAQDLAAVQTHAQQCAERKPDPEKTCPKLSQA